MRGSRSSGIFLVEVAACLLLLQLLSGSVVSALSVTTTPHIHRIRSVINSSSAHNLVSTQPPFPLANAKKRPPYYNHNAILSSRRQMSSSSTISKSNNGKSSFNNKVQLILSVLCNNITRHFTKVRKSIIRATVILSLILFGYTKGTITPPFAHAAAYWGKSNPDVVLVDTSTTTTTPKIKSSFGKKFTKLLVTAGAVSVGLSIVPNNGNGGDGGNNSQEDDGGVLSVVPKDKPSPLPLPKVAVDEATTTSKPKPSPSNTNNGSISSNKDSILVKNLDSKIEMLRQREETAKQAAETKRLEELAHAEEARKVEQINIDARISAEAEKVERALREKKLRIEEEKEREREEKLSELEAGKKELWRLEQIKKEQQQQVSNEGGGGGGGVATNGEGRIDTTTANKTIQQQPRPLQIIATGSSGSPAKTKEEDLELTTRIILDYVNSQEDTEGVVDDDDDE